MKVASILASILCVFICDGLFASDASVLKLVKPPKAPLSIEARMRLAAPAKRAWDSYEKLYNTFVSIAADSEMLYSKSKSPVMEKNIAGLNSLAKSPSWKNIATTQPFKVKAGEEDLQRKIYKFAEINSDFFLVMHPDKAKTVTTTFNPQPEVPICGNAKQYSTDKEREYHETIDALQNLNRPFSSEQGGILTVEVLPSRNERRKRAQLLLQERNRIFNEARENGEAWAQLTMP